MKTYRLLLACFFLCFACRQPQQSAFTGEVISTAAEVGTIPEESIYNLTDTFESQNGDPVQLRDFSGKPTVISMIFTHCAYACPRLTADVQKIEEELGEQAREVNFVLASFDSERDTPERLKYFQDLLKLDDRFTLLHGSVGSVRTLSVLMNIQFQQNADGDFSHSNVISVLDAGGNLVYQKEGIQANHEETIATINRLLGEK